MRSVSFSFDALAHAKEQPKRAVLSRSPSGSCCHGGEDLLNLGRTLSLLDPLGEHPQATRLNARDGLIAGGTVSHRSRNLCDLGNPTARRSPARFLR